MKYLCTAIAFIAVTLLCSMAALGQTPANQKQFNKEGLSFDYPNGWTLTENSDADAQQLVLSKSDSDAQIRIFVLKGTVNTPDKLKLVREKIVDPYVNATSGQLEQLGGKPTRTPATIQVGSLQAEGVRLQAVLDGEPGEAGIYWLTLGNRLVVLTLFGPDKSLKRVTPVWDTLRGSLRVEELKQPQKANPK